MVCPWVGASTRSSTVYYLTDARITSAVHVLTAYDRDDGPETLLDLTTQATVSGYMVIRTDDSVGDIDVGIGPGDQDPTQSVTIASQSSSTYSGMFFPDTAPDFERGRSDRHGSRAQTCGHSPSRRRRWSITGGRGSCEANVEGSLRTVAGTNRRRRVAATHRRGRVGHRNLAANDPRVDVSCGRSVHAARARSSLFEWSRWCATLRVGGVIAYDRCPQIDFVPVFAWGDSTPRCPAADRRQR